MSEPVYQKFGAATVDPSAGLQMGINAQKANLSEVLKGVEGLMKNQETQYIQENTANVQNYFKDKLQTGGLNAALTQPVDQEELKQKFGNMLDINAVNTAVTAKTDLIKKNVIDKAAAKADKHLTLEGGRDPIKAAATFKQTILDNGGTHSFADEKLPGYVAQKATEVQNIATAKLQEADARDGDYLMGLRRGGAETEAIQRKAVVDKITDPTLRAKEDLRLRKLGDQFLNISDTAKAEIGVHTQVRAAEQKAAIDKASLRMIDIENRLSVASKYVPDDEAYTQTKLLTKTIGNNAVNEIGKTVTNWFEAFAPDDDTTHLQNFTNGLVTAGHASDDVQAATWQAYREFNKNTHRTFKDITASEMAQIETRTTGLLSAIQGRNALTAEALKEKINIANVTAIETAKSAKLQTKLLNAAQNQALGRNASIQKTADQYRLDGISAENKASAAKDKAEKDMKDLVAKGKANTATGIPTDPVQATLAKAKALAAAGGTSSKPMAVPTTDGVSAAQEMYEGKRTIGGVNLLKVVQNVVRNRYNPPIVDTPTDAQIKTNLSGYTPERIAELAIINNGKSSPTSFSVRPEDDGADYLGGSRLSKVMGNRSTADAVLEQNLKKKLEEIDLAKKKKNKGRN